MARRKRKARAKDWIDRQWAQWRKLPPLRRLLAAGLGVAFVFVAAGLIAYIAFALIAPLRPQTQMRPPAIAALPKVPGITPPAIVPGPAPSDLPAWRRFAVASPPVPANAVRVAIVIDDMGLDRPRSARIIDLPGPLTVSFLPYGRDLAAQMQSARSHGHELMLHLPMEPSGNYDPGPDALRIDQSPGEIRRRIDEALAKTPGIVGVNNHMGSKFTAARPGMEVVIDEVKRAGLLFLDSRTTAQTVGAQIAGEKGVPSLSRNVFLDDVLSADNVVRQLDELERIAKRQGYAIAIGHPHDNTIAALAAWLPGLRAKGIVLVPLTALVDARR